MYNYMRCLIVSVKFHKKFFTQSTHENILSHVINRHTNTLWSKRFCCQATIQEKNDRTNIGVKYNLQQKLDKFLSDPENKKVFEILKLEIDVMRHNAEKVPEELSTKDWLILIKMTSKTQRRKYLKFLWLNEKAQVNRKAKKELKKTEALVKKAQAEQEDTGEIKYGLLHNTLFLRIYDTTINRYYNNKLLQAMMFEPKIVLDCGYENYMTQREMHDCAKQLTLSFATNRLHVNPMSLYFCNMENDGSLLQYCNIIMPNLLDNDFPAIITSQSYLDLFPRDQLVYLTPHCRTDMTEYNPDMVYIIGAMVDKHNQQPLSLAKAKKDGIQMAKLPLEKYLPWGSGSTKSLTLNQMISVLLDLRHTKDWKKALEHVPTRKLREAREHMLELKLKRTLRFRKSEAQSSNILNSDSEIQTDFTFASRKTDN
ncbi:mitochondrial ribonuclease P protein 1 homolog [Formica exsecta]|uniref:mitochondrial ribonuclease P protein 1 homolog n=1 Tax=Formica exsecta TaxID=72781 RepID=UPI001143F986|nr:mitochondrial ribonuclease P protein 1 homolog [Formica exsecta]